MANMLLVFLFVAVVAMSSTQLSANASLIQKPQLRDVFYVFDANGIAILNPVTKQITKRINHDTKLPGTTETICTSSMEGKCSWTTGSAFAPRKYIFAADLFGNRLIVIDIEKQKAVKMIKTGRYPYQIEYIRAMDEVWVLCLENNTLNVIGVIGGTTKISDVKDVNSLVVKHSIRAQDINTPPDIQGGFFRSENCQNHDKSHPYGIVTHEREPGIHKINLLSKTREKFINTSAHGCKSTLHIAYTSVKKYALVQCVGLVDSLIVVDVASDRVVHHNDQMTAKAQGYPYTSPDGKYAVVLQRDRIISYYFENANKEMVRLQDIIISQNFWPRSVAFVKIVDGFNLYVTSKNTSRIMLLTFNKNTIKTGGFIEGVGLAANTTNILKGIYLYKPWYMSMLNESGRTYVQAEFEQFAARKSMQRIYREIEVGCGLKDYHIASPSLFTHKIALIDARKNRFVAQIGGLKLPRGLVWIGDDAQSKGTVLFGPRDVLIFVMISIITVLI